MKENKAAKTITKKIIKNVKSVLWFKKFKRNISFRLLYYSL